MTALSDTSKTLASLRTIAQALSAAWDVDTTLDLIARQTAQVMQADSCSIYLREEGSETLWLRASTGLSQKALGRSALKIGEGITGWATQQGTPVAVRDAQHDPRFKLLPETREKPYRSLLAVPLANRGHVIGAMNVQTSAFHDFTADEIELLALISDLAAGALDRALLYDNMKRQIEELTTLAKVSATVNAPLYLDEMLDVVVEMTGKVMGATLCSLQLVDPQRGEIITRSAERASKAYRDKPPLKLDEGITGLVIRTRTPLAVLDVRTDPRYRYRALAKREGLVSLLCVPLVVRDHVIGALNCYTAEMHRFTPEETALLSTLANQTALAIENAQLVTRAAIVREMHHRIKNNLQTVAMLLRLQASEATPLSPADALHVSVDRILSIAAVHEVLAEQGFRLVDVKDVCTRIAHHAAQSLVRPGLDLRVSVDGQAVVLPSRPATSLALVVNELLHNALEHAFVGRTTGTVRITLGHGAHDYIVEVSDDGVGWTGTPRPSSLGLEIVETLVREDLRGKLTFSGGAHGTRVTVRLPHALGEA